ncbi:MAG TPA: PA2779 family protein [Desulfobacterales bacterium]|nr:PA2779 family protein [Desulfobacterales bacterium]
MNLLRKKSAPISILMIIFIVNLITPIQPALAALIDTHTYLEKQQIDNARDKVSAFLSKEKVIQVMTQQGINPEEVRSRLANLSDQEVMKISEQIENLPAGGNALGFVIGILIVVLLILVIMKLM